VGDATVKAVAELRKTAPSHGIPGVTQHRWRNSAPLA
jgi:hypothetical protein